MKLRVTLGRFLIRIGRFIQSLAIMVMRPDDLVDFSKLAYAGQKRAEGWGGEKVVNAGLRPEEKALLDKIPLRKGRILVLGVGGGREAIYLAKLGYEATGVDFVPEMVEKAKENAIKEGVRIDGLVQEISRLEIPRNSYDIVWLSAAMYSCVPTRVRRIKMLRTIKDILKPNGYFACQFHWQTKNNSSLKIAKFLRRLLAYITLGNLWHEEGDMLWANIEFIHAFSSEDKIKSEFQEGGFEVEYLSFGRELPRGEALLKKAL